MNGTGAAGRGATEAFASFDGRRIAFDDAGAGAAVLCLPGLTRSMRDFEGIGARLAVQHRVVRMDYRGRGTSDHAEDPVAEYTLPVESQDVMALMAHLGIGRAALLGTSRGGLIGMGLAAHAPQAVSCLVLNDVGPVLEPAGIEFILTYLGRDPGFASFEDAAAALERAYAAQFPDLGRADWLDYARRSFRDNGGRPVLDYDPRLRDATEAALSGPPADLWPVFEAIDVPILLLRGANSDLLSVETVAEMQARKPAMQVVTVPDRGHVPFLTEPVAADAIAVFLGKYAP